MEYGKYKVIAEIDGVTKFFFDLVAVSAEAAIADVRAAYGELRVIQYGAQ